VTRGPQRAPVALPPRLAKPQFPPELPITAHIDRIVALLCAERVVVVVGETGSGKTTQLPKACLAAGLGRRGMIAHTQPRRLAARAVSARIAEELGVALGAEVGYAVRFDDRASAATRVRVLTDGLLLAEMQRDARLGRYECVIVDEAHERSLNVDFLLGGLKRLLARRTDLKVVITSATIDAAAFADHFGGAPVVEVAGRGHPVQFVYRPVEAGACKNATEADNEPALVECLEAIAKDAPASRRDILVFQSGEREIFDSARLLKRHFAERFDILPLYARLPATEQARVFAPARRRRVVLATNIAETSLTVPNIGYVVDPGFARVSRYSYRAKLQRLPIEPISQASARQRAGRCGRVGPGVCYRLYSEDDFQARPAYTDPEIKRTNLAAVVLAMRAWRLGDVETFPFLDPPAPRAVADAVRLLRELQALDGETLTDIGRAMARLPVDPRLARMLVAASGSGALKEVLVVVSALAAQDPRLRPPDRQAAADQAHALFEAKNAGDGNEEVPRQRARSDFETFLRLWEWLEDARVEHTRAAFRRVLEKRFLSPARVREWRALHRQLLLACRRLGWKVNQQPADYATLHQALLAGSLGFVGVKRDPGKDAARGPGAPGRKRAKAVEYDGPRGLRFRLFPGSALRRAAPQWVMAAQISDTGHTFARCVAAVEPGWIERAAAHIAKRTHSEARWDAQRGEAVVLESVSVYGLVVASERRRRAAEVVPEAARELFVLEALVRPDARLAAPFLERNQQRIAAVLERQGKHRRMDLLASEREQAAFYLARLPAAVCSLATWRQFAAGPSRAELARFEMREADVLAGEVPGANDEDFPPVLPVGEGEVPLSYKFAPGAADDGVTARVDLAALARLDLDALEWLVPGFLEEKCLALVRGLPKPLRRRLAPAPDRVRVLLPRLFAGFRQGSLAAALSAAARDCFGVDIPRGAWGTDAVPPHLRLHVAVCAGDGRVLHQGRNVAALRERAAASVEVDVLAAAHAGLERRGITEFPAEGLPDSVAVTARGACAVVYPLLVDRGDSVDLLFRASPQGRAAGNRAGLTRLALLAQPAAARRLRRDAEEDADLARGYAPLGRVTALANALVETSAWHAYFAGRELPATAGAFAARLAESALAPVFRETMEQARVILAKRLAVHAELDAMTSPALAASRADLLAQLDDLVGADFLANTRRERLPDLPRYLDGMAWRIERLRLGGRLARDQAGIAAVGEWQRRLAALDAAGADTEELRFLLQEFRVATFSQPVGARDKVSAKRLEAHFRAAELKAGVG